MLIKTGMSDSIREFLEKDLLINLNIIGIMENVPEAEIYIDNLENPKGVFVCNGYMHYIYSKEDKFIDEVLETFIKDGFYGFSGVEVSIAEKIKSRFKINWENPCTLYYLPEERLDLSLIKNPVRSIDIKDAAIVDKYYQYRNEWSIERIRKDITKRLSSAVYVDDDLACWVLIHEDDSMGIMYTREEYRRNGYAVDVTIDLASKVIKQGKIPFLQIVEGNNMSPGLARKCGFVECGQVTWFGVIAGTPKEFVEVNDNSRKQFLNSFSAEVMNRIINPGTTYDGMYIIIDMLDDKDMKVPGLVLEHVEGRESMETWCDTVCKGYGFEGISAQELKAALMKIVSDKNLNCEFYTGYMDGVAVSSLALHRVEQDVCGVYLLSVIPELRGRGLGLAALSVALKEAGKGGMELAVLQSPEGCRDFFGRIGFEATHTINDMYV